MFEHKGSNLEFDRPIRRSYRKPMSFLQYERNVITAFYRRYKASGQALSTKGDIRKIVEIAIITSRLRIYQSI
jgi:hypothetical protein